MANKINLTHKKADGSTVIQTVPDVNPGAADSAVGAFFKAFAELSNNTLTAIQKVETEPVGDQIIKGTENADAVTISSYKSVVDPLAGDDVLVLSGAVANTINATTGNNSVSVSANSRYNTIICGEDTANTIAFDSNKNCVQNLNTSSVLKFSTHWDAVSSTVDGSNATIAATNDNKTAIVTLTDFSSKTVTAAFNEQLAEFYLGETVNAVRLNNSQSDIYISAGLLDASINNTGANVYIKGGAGDDTITNSGANCTIYAGTGDNAAFLNGGGHLFIHKYGSNDSVFGWTDNDSLLLIDNQSLGESVEVDGGAEFTDRAGAKLLLCGNFDNAPVTLLPQTLTATSAPENVTVTAENGKPKILVQQTVAGAEVQTLTANEGYVAVAFNAGSGDDSIHVQQAIKGFTIMGGRARDTITIDAGAGGMVYNWASGDNVDIIQGWHFAEDANPDTLEAVYSNGTTSTLMSTDGNDFTFKFAATKLVTFQNITNGKHINYTENGKIGKFYIPFIMQGTSKSNTIINTQHTGTAAQPWIIDAPAGNDTIENYCSYVSISGGAGKDTIENYCSYVSISGGAGNDTIKVASQNGVLAQGVTINGGTYNDYIDVADNTILSGEVTVHAAHLFQFGTADGDDSILGFNSNDSIQILADASDLTNLKMGVYQGTTTIKPNNSLSGVINLINYTGAVKIYDASGNPVSPT